MGQYVRVAVTTVFLAASIGEVLAATETVVTTYVTKVQEERQSTRFTLTEWLRIKERMKMMDVWMAMFSNPKEDKFRPELNLTYAVTRGDMKATSDQDVIEEAPLASTALRGQLFLTNLFTGSTGAKLINIDFGVEGYQRESEPFAPEVSASTITVRRVRTQYYSANFRLFGKSIQDSSLVAKVGKYEIKNALPVIQGQTRALEESGRFYGGEIQLYLFRWLGFEGNYLNFAPIEFGAADSELSGTYYDYMAYIEISLLRLVGGMYQEDWVFKTAAGNAKTSESGIIAGAKIQL